ncbi:hypothetical protein JNUCC1_00329 [Lentibacillus sp. JNUCC-1]|nr:hypothetical protein [Lentibacillus sp. JNUCC-1]
MRFIMTFFWSILIGCAVSYVLASMAGDSFQLIHGLIAGLSIGVIVLILGEGVLKENPEA